MSASLLRRGLELFNDDVKGVSKGKPNVKQRTPSLAAAKELVSTKRQGVTKQVKRLQGRLGPGKSKATVKDKRIKSAVEEFRKKQGQSQMSANLQYFLNTGFKTTDSDTSKIQHHNRGRKARDQPRPPTKAKKSAQPESLFTEDEFQKFQLEYFGRTVEEK